jgi:sugar/nucleoside kinase (ribokinase family)
MLLLHAGHAMHGMIRQSSIAQPLQQNLRNRGLQTAALKRPSKRATGRNLIMVDDSRVSCEGTPLLVRRAMQTLQTLDET